MRPSRVVYSLTGVGSVRVSYIEYLAGILKDCNAGNTRVISQTALDHFRTSLADKKHDPYSVLLRRNKLPMQLLDDAANPNLRKVHSPEVFPHEVLSD